MSEIPSRSPGPAVRPGRRRFGLLARLILTLVSTVSTLLLLETIARVYAQVTLNKRGIDFDPELGWHALPNVRKKSSEWGQTRPASTNSQGWRDAQRSFDRAPGVKRAVVLGDSMVFGYGVDDGERLTE